MWLYVVDDLVSATRVFDVGVAASLAAIPRGRVVDLTGSDRFAFEIATDPLPDDAPAAVSVVIERATSLADVVDDVLAALSSAVVGLFPLWLPGGEHLGESASLDDTVITDRARRLAASGGHSASAMAVLARAGLARSTTVAPVPDRVVATSGVPPETLARECARLIADTYRRDHVCLAVSHGIPDPSGAAHDVWTPAEQQSVAAACEWIARHADVGICLVGDPLPHIDRFTPVPWVGPVTDGVRVTDVPEEADLDPVIRPTDGPVRLQLPALAGRPHPNSVAEQRLHTFLARLDWASDARWNMTFAPDALQSAIRVDVAFPAARCVVEIDGDDHRAAAKYTADRKRDNMLQLAGYTVLRFTNDEVLADVSRVASTIESCLTERDPNPSPSTPPHVRREAHQK